MRSTDQIKRFLAIALLGLIALFLFFLWPKGNSESEVEGKHHTPIKGTSVPDAATSKTSGRPGKSSRLKEPGRPAEPSHTIAQLKGFYFPELTSDPCSLKEALDLVRKEYYEICAQTGETPQPLDFKIEGTPEGPIHFNLTNVPFWQAMNHLCALAGMKVESQGPPVHIVEVPETVDAVTRMLSVPPDFPARVAIGQLDDPFESSGPATGDVDGGLRKRGIIKGTESSATFIPDKSALIVRGTARDHHRVATLRELETLPPVMIQMSAKIVEVPDGTNIPTGVHSAEDAQEILKDLMKQSGTQILSAPTVIVHPGQTAQVVLGGVVPENNSTPAQIPLGHQLDLSGSFTGFQLQTSIGSSLTTAVDGQEAAFSTRKVTSSFLVQPGERLITRSDVTDGSTPQYIFYTPATVDVPGLTVPTITPDAVPSDPPLKDTPLPLPLPTP